MLELVSHPEFPSTAVTAIRVDAGRRSGGELIVRFAVDGDLEAVRWPEPIGSGRADGLWQHTCFEAFVGFADEPGYWECNLSPSLQWAAYRFDDYRAGMRAEPDALLHGNWNPAASKLHFRSPHLATPRAWRLAVAAVIEAADGTKSFWAFRHPAGPPDFHHPACFAATLPPPPSA